jgi:hypothetical protein
MLSWEEMEWLFPDFEETGVIYHDTAVSNLAGIFVDGLMPGVARDPEDRHETIYGTLREHRPDHIPDWVDHGRCIFAYMNRRRFSGSACPGATPVRAVVGSRVDARIAGRTWVGSTSFSDHVYCPEEAGWLDTEARAAYFRDVLAPESARAYWYCSLSFEANLHVRFDHLLPNQGKTELLVCVDRVPPGLLSLEAVRVRGEAGEEAAVLKPQCPHLFAEAEACLREGRDGAQHLAAIAQRACDGD